MADVVTVVPEAVVGYVVAVDEVDAEDEEAAVAGDRWSSRISRLVLLFDVDVTSQQSEPPV